MLVEKSSQTVFTLLDDGTGVLLNLETLSYYSLNRTAVVLWQEIERAKPSTLNALVQATCARFEANEDAVQQEIVDFVERLQEFKMVRLVSA